jgi:phage baseplate assembly protein W
MGETFINIRFPFKDSPIGNFLELTKVDKRAIKSDLMHLLLTNKGERLYLPDFGANLRKFLFEPNLLEVSNDIRNELQTEINNYIPNLKIDNLEVNPFEGNEHAVIVRLDYTVTRNTFTESDFVLIQL